MNERARLEHREKFRNDYPFDPGLSMLINYVQNQSHSLLSHRIGSVLQIIGDYFDIFLIQKRNC